MQRIVPAVFQTSERGRLCRSQLDRPPVPEPIEAVVAHIEAQDTGGSSRPISADGLPIYDEIKYVHVARGRA